MTASESTNIVIGVDGSEHAERALAWAIDEAKLRRVRMQVEGQAADVLIETAAGATLLVVGSRGHGASWVFCSALSVPRAPTMLPVRS